MKSFQIVEFNAIWVKIKRYNFMYTCRYEVFGTCVRKLQNELSPIETDRPWLPTIQKEKPPDVTCLLMELVKTCDLMMESLGNIGGRGTC